MERKGRQTIGRFVALLHRMAAVYLGRELSALGVGTGQYIFLAELYDEEGQTQEELTRRACVDKANTARALRRLEDAGYVRRVPDAQDGRVKRVLLQPAAREIEDEFWRILTRWSGIIAGDMDAERRDRLLEDLKELTDNAAADLQRYGPDPHDPQEGGRP
ncbi:MAG: MarR family transcriptional regulator [Desulfovibrionaceae bacterium]|jgi:DNA-binding MarR family transcriptional regulator|nr:MarR family transcriptional regulator [Desulfovibrionaceae bacterium]